MLQLYVFASVCLGLLSMLPWLLVAIGSPGVMLASPAPHETMTGVVIAALIVWFYPVYVWLFARRSWRLLRGGEGRGAAGPATMIALPALAVIAYVVAGQGGQLVASVMAR